jgi:8-oxo-dGTP pyrophosphatase MutT (NUDIX family)
MTMFPLRPGIPLPDTTGRGRDAGVLVLVYPLHGAPHLVLTRRTETVQNHKGQVSLPGGAREGDETIVQTAQREAQEELAIPADGLELLGTLSPIYVGVSDYLITPVVALSAQRPNFQADPIEVVEVIEAPLSLFVDESARRTEDWEIHGAHVHVPFFAVGQHKVWGATAMILAEFAALLESELRSRDPF